MSSTIAIDKYPLPDVVVKSVVLALCLVTVSASARTEKANIDDAIFGAQLRGDLRLAFSTPAKKGSHCTAETCDYFAAKVRYLGVEFNDLLITVEVSSGMRRSAAFSSEGPCGPLLDMFFPSTTTCAPRVVLER